MSGNHEPDWDEPGRARANRNDAASPSQPTRSAEEDEAAITRKDNEHLRMLVIFHYVVAGISAVTSCFVLPHLIIGIVFLVAPPSSSSTGPFPAALFGGIFFGVACVVICWAWTEAIVIFIAAKRLRDRKSHTYCLVAAGIMCAGGIFALTLAIFTFVVLLRPSVKRQFGVPNV